jgi:glycosyltransferase involved in cell wall biosynthesis
MVVPPMSEVSPSLRPRTTAIVPAFNEGETLAEVLLALQRTPLVDEVLVVSDGSTDDTVDVARRTGVRAIHLKSNWGKGIAMATGVAHTDSPLLVFVDADILRLSEEMLQRLITPVAAGELDMNIGIRHRGALVNSIHRHTGPLLSGIRCLRREIFEAVPERYLEGYRIETGLNWACRRLAMRRGTRVLHHLKHRVKERKLGLWAGFAQRCHMFGAVFSAWARLRVAPPPVSPPPSRTQRDLELEYINF